MKDKIKLPYGYEAKELKNSTKDEKIEVGKT